jgi:hypothetical protein
MSDDNPKAKCKKLPVTATKEEIRNRHRVKMAQKAFGRSRLGGPLSAQAQLAEGKSPRPNLSKHHPNMLALIRRLEKHSSWWLINPK